MAVAPAAAVAAEEMVESEGEILNRSPHPNHYYVVGSCCCAATPQKPCASPGPGVEEHAHLPQPGRWV